MLETEKTELRRITDKFNIKISKIFDCGSRDAVDGIELGEIFSAREVHFFECNPQAIKLCEKNIENNRHASYQMSLHKVALGDKKGEVSFFAIDPERTITPHEGGNIGASSLFQASDQYKKEKYAQTEIKVPMAPLSAYLSDGLAPDLIWMDVQGAEVIALKGLGPKLKDVACIHVEVGFRPVYKGQPLFRDVYKLLSKDFRLEFISMGRWPRLVWLYSWLGFGPWISNAIFVNKRFY